MQTTIPTETLCPLISGRQTVNTPAHEVHILQCTHTFTLTLQPLTPILFPVCHPFLPPARGSGPKYTRRLQQVSELANRVHPTMRAPQTQVAKLIGHVKEDVVVSQQCLTGPPASLNSTNLAGCVLPRSVLSRTVQLGISLLDSVTTSGHALCSASHSKSMQQVLIG